MQLFSTAEEKDILLAYLRKSASIHSHFCYYIGMCVGQVPLLIPLSCERDKAKLKMIILIGSYN